MHTPVTLGDHTGYALSVQNTQDAHEATHLGHQGGATCKFLGHFTVGLVSTKNCTFHLGEPTKSNTLNQFTVQKYKNENAAHSQQGLAIIMSQIDRVFCRFPVVLVDLSEPDSYEARMNRYQPTPGNLVDFNKIEVQSVQIRIQRAIVRHLNFQFRLSAQLLAYGRRRSSELCETCSFRVDFDKIGTCGPVSQPPKLVTNNSRAKQPRRVRIFDVF